MKKQMVALAMSIIMSASMPTYADGLTGLFSQSPQSNGREEKGGLPDPGEVLGSSGELMESNYNFADDYFCDVYAYNFPTNKSYFIQEYKELAATAGFTVAEGTLEGTEAYVMENESSSSYLIFVKSENTMLLLVDVNASFKPDVANS